MMLVINFKRFYKGLKKIKGYEPAYLDIENHEEMRRILSMLDESTDVKDIDLSSFSVKTLQQMLEEYYYYENEYVLEEGMNENVFLIGRLKKIPPGRVDDVYFF